MRAFLEKQQIADETFFAEVDDAAKQEALSLRERVLAMPDPEPLTLFDHVYAHGSPEVEAQREQMSRYLDSFEGSNH